MTVTAGPDFGKLNIEFKQGETWTLELVLCDSDRVALDLSSGYTAKMQARDYATSTDTPMIDLSNGSGITLQAGTNDDAVPDNCVPNVVCALTDEATAAISSGSYSYDLFVEQTGSDDNRCWIQGKVVVIAAVTRG